MVEGGFSSVSACNLDLVADWYLAFIHACASPYNSNYVGILLMKSIIHVHNSTQVNRMLVMQK